MCIIRKYEVPKILSVLSVLFQLWKVKIFIITCLNGIHSHGLHLYLMHAVFVFSAMDLTLFAVASVESL